MDLDSLGFAMETLSETLSESNFKIPKNTILSIDAKRSIFDRLMNTTDAYKSSDLIIALYGVRNERKKCVHYRILEKIEAEIIQKIESMSVKEILNILNAYSFVCRKHPGQ